MGKQHNSHQRANQKSRHLTDAAVKGRVVSSDDRRWWMKVSRDQVCAKCGCTDRGQLEVDHIVPLAVGGPDVPENWQWLCKPCNKRKADKAPAKLIRQFREQGLMK